MKVSKLTCWFIIVSLSIIILTSCQSDVIQTNQPEPEDANVKTEEPEPTKEPLPEPSKTPLPTDTLTPTDNPVVNISNVRFGNPAHLMLDWKDWIYNLTFSPDGDKLAFTGSEKIKVINMRNLSTIAVLDGHSNQVKGMAWTPDGTIISASLDGTVILWETNSFTQSSVLQAGPVHSLDISPDGLKFVVGQEAGNIQFWDVASNEMVDSIVSPTGSTVKSLSWSQENGLVASGEESGDIHIIDPNSNKITHSLSLDETKASSTNSVEWSPDGKILASGHQNGLVYLWDTTSWGLIKTIEWNEGWVGAVTWLPNSTVLTISGEGTVVTLWDIDSGELITSVGIPNSFHSSFTWSPNGNMLVLTDIIEEDDEINAALFFYKRSN